MTNNKKKANIPKQKHIYMVGIKGVAMTALALCYQDQGHYVTGSDVGEEFVTDKLLLRRGIKFESGFDASQITADIDWVVYTGAHQGKHNAQVVAANAKKIPTLSQAEALGELIAGKKVISVCGTGGKSTTSAMIAWVLNQAKLDPSFAVGVGNIPNFDVSGRYVPDSEWFVAEADEYAVDPTSDHRPRFTFQRPQIIVCTNLQYDHPDIYPDFETMQQTFLHFFNTLPAKGLLVINADDPVLTKIASLVRTDIQVIRAKEQPLNLIIPGEHNRRNAAYAHAVATFLGVPPEIALKSLGSFAGTMRRLEYKGKLENCVGYDDYAHTPSEIEATLVTLRQMYSKQKIIAIFQPHTYSRTRALFDQFSHSFTDADEVLLLDIFSSAREQIDPNITSDKLVSAIKCIDTKKQVTNVKTINNAVLYLQQKKLDDCVVVTLGAGDIYKIWDKLWI